LPQPLMLLCKKNSGQVFAVFTDFVAGGRVCASLASWRHLELCLIVPSHSAAMR